MNLFGKLFSTLTQPRIKEIDKPLDRNTVATNPGGIEVDDRVYKRCFPKRPLRRDQFRRGAVNPAVVVSASPWLVAVATDLACGPGFFCPVVKVVAQPLECMTGAPPSIGMKLATIASYSGRPHTGRWDTFDPIVINCVSGDQQAITRVFSSIPQAEWDDLENALASLPTPLEPNLYQYGQWQLGGA